eukprot:7803788-Pyramimonas_sp.AAC.1
MSHSQLPIAVEPKTALGARGGRWRARWRSSAPDARAREALAAASCQRVERAFAVSTRSSAS